MNKLLNKIAALVVLTVSASFTPLSANYNWQQHVPDWHQFIPNESQNQHSSHDPDYNWQKHIPSGAYNSGYNWQQHIPNFQNGNNSNGSTTYYGPVSKQNYHASGMTVYGPLSLTDSVISGPVVVHGPAHLCTTQVTGTFSLYGIMKVSKSSLANIEAWTTEIILLDSTADNIFIGKNGNDYRPQGVVLSGTTDVSGSITFEQGNGIVVVAPTAKFSGQVNGGKLVKE